MVALPTGRVQTGILKPGMSVHFAPANLSAECAEVELHHEKLDQAVAGDNIAFSIKGSEEDASAAGTTGKGVTIQKGYVASDANDDPAKETASFFAQVIMMNRPGWQGAGAGRNTSNRFRYMPPRFSAMPFIEGKRSSAIMEARDTTQCCVCACVLLLSAAGISAGYTPIIDCHTAHIPCKFETIHQKIDRRTGKLIEKNPERINNGEACLVTLVPSKPMCVETFAKYPPLGRFAVRDMRQTVAVGVVKKTTAGSPAAAAGGNKGGQGK
jgi:translation elongation factor EF-1alpha